MGRVLQSVAAKGLAGKPEGFFITGLRMAQHTGEVAYLA